MFITDTSFTIEEFKEKVVELAKEMAKKIPDASVNLKPDNIIQPGITALLLEVIKAPQCGRWSITHSARTGKVSCIRVMQF